MERKAASGILVALLSTSMLTLVNIQPAKASGTIYIRADGNIDPQTAPILTLDKVTYTFTDNINNSIVVERDNIVVDGEGYGIQGMGIGTGIDLTGRRNVTIKNMEIKTFSYGIALNRSSFNTIFGNNITGNTDYGVWFFESSSNRFYHNNIIHNVNQVYLNNSVNNTWDNACEGNYWSDYNGTDFHGDGIGDTYLPWQEVEHYPLMNPYWNPSDINHDLKVDITDISTSGLAFGSQPGYPNWNPHADITGPINLKPDGKVDIRDIAFIAIDYGRNWNVRAAIYLDKYIYSPDVKVFWELQVSTPIEVRVVDDKVGVDFVTAKIASSVDSKEMTLTKADLGVFLGTVHTVGLRLGESISDASVFNARYGDVITAEYVDPWFGDIVTANALFAFPKYVKNQSYTNPYAWKLFDEKGIPIWNYGGTIGIQYNPVTISQYALAQYHAYLNTENTTFKEKFLLQANWLAGNAQQKGNYTVWEYKFDWPSFGMTDPWVSAMAQGEGLSVLTRAYTLTGNTTYLNVAETAVNAFEVEMSIGGVRYTDSDGVWFEECADENATSSKILNGFVFALLGLYEYSFETNSSKGYTLFWEGTNTLLQNLHRYDTGWWSYYDLIGHVASQRYHQLHIEQLKTMYELTGNQTFLDYSNLFQSYM